MRILYLSQYFPPEIGATQTRGYEMARGLVKAGHKVTVITEFPNHPIGIIPEEYRGKIMVREEMDGIEIIRVWVRASPVKNFRNRIVFYLTFMLAAALAGLLLARGKYNALYVTSPPLFVGGAGLVISLLRGIPMFFEVRDLWPLSAVELGQLNRLWAILLSTWLERACYHHARHIVVVTQGIKDILLERGYPAEKISLIPNGANVELYYKQPVDRELMDKFGFDPGCFVLIFTGLVGLAHDLETVLKAADILRHTSARFLIVGDGPKKEDLLEMRSKLGLQNVIFNEAVPEQELPAYLSIAHAGLCTGLSLDITRKALPVKMFTYMACELPVILTLEGESAQLLRDARAGLVVVPENPIALAGAISELMADPDSCLELGLNGRRLVESRFSRQMQAHDLAMLLANSRRQT